MGGDGITILDPSIPDITSSGITEQYFPPFNTTHLARLGFLARLEGWLGFFRISNQASPLATFFSPLAG
jgi:hypothetical protein